MGNLRVFLKSARFTFRNKKRIIWFVFLFTMLSVFVIIFANTFSDYNKSDLLRNKGVIITQSNYDLVREDNATVQQFIQKVQNYAQVEKIVVHRYIDYGNSLRIFDIDISDPWAYSLITPRSTITGRFIHSQGEALVLVGQEIKLSSPASSNASIDPSTGDKISIYTGGTKISFYVVGEISQDAYNDPTGKGWIFVDKTTFDQIASKLNSTVYIYEISILAKGNILSNTPYENKRQILSKTKTDIVDMGLAPNYFNLPDGIEPNIEKRIEEKNTSLLIFGIGMFAGLAISFLYGALLIRFRKTEIAVLKTVGYSSWNIRAAVLAEVLSISFVGYVLGVLGMQAYLLKNAASLVNSILSLEVLGISFLIVVLFDIPSVFISTHSLVKIKPLDVLRDTG